MTTQDMNVIFSAGAAVRSAVPAAVARHKCAGELTWRLLHRMESEVLAEVAASGKHDERVLNMFQAASLRRFPKYNRPVSFDSSDFIPIVYGTIIDVWHVAVGH